MIRLTKRTFSMVMIPCALAFTLSLSPVALAAVTATSAQAVSVYTAPGKGKVKEKIAKGAQISLIAKNGKYYKIKTASGKVGYIPMNAVSNTSTEKKTDSSNTYALESSGNEDFDQILELVNQERIKAGLHPLQFDSRLQKAARVRAEELVENFSHVRPDGSTVFSIFDEMNLSNVYRAENIADGQETAEAVVASWLKSPNHRKNIMGKNYHYMGIGHYADENKWAQLFWGPMAD